jgi:hypothetical protein
MDVLSRGPNALAGQYDEYLVEGLKQSRVAFRVGTAFGALSVIVMLAGAVKVLFLTGYDESGAFVTVCGAVAEAISVLLLVHAKRTSRQMIELFDRGRRDDDLAIARRIADELKGTLDGDWLRVVLALRLAGCEADSLSTLLASAPTARRRAPRDELHERRLPRPEVSGANPATGRGPG